MGQNFTITDISPLIIQYKIKDKVSFQCMQYNWNYFNSNSTNLAQFDGQKQIQNGILIYFYKSTVQEYWNHFLCIGL